MLSGNCTSNECNQNQNLQCLNDSVIRTANTTGWWYVLLSIDAIPSIYSSEFLSVVTAQFYSGGMEPIVAIRAHHRGASMPAMYAMPPTNAQITIWCLVHSEVALLFAMPRANVRQPNIG